LLAMMSRSAMTGKFSIRSALRSALSNDSMPSGANTVADLHEVFALDDVGLVDGRKGESELEQRRDDAPPVLLRAAREHVHVLRRARITEQDGAALADEQVLDAVPGEGIRHEPGLLGTEGLVDHSCAAGA
jgi:hypothetical protein